MLYMYILLAYLCFVWIILRLTIPQLGFFKKPIGVQLPQSLEAAIEECKINAQNNSEFLKLAYEYVTQKYTGSRIKTITQWQKAFADPYTSSSGFLPCTGQNYLLRTMLIKSGHFTEDDIKVKVVPLNFFIHQYLLVSVDGADIAVDPWSHFLGKKIGEASIFLG
jgi:hypothetical protein